MSQQPISIIGAGIGARVLGQALRKKGVPAMLFEKGAAAPRFPYGITLHPWAYKPLLKILGIDELTFRKRTAVDAPRYGQVYASNPRDFSFRVHRGKLEQLLEEGLDIRYEHALVSIDHSRDLLSLSFANGEQVSESHVIGFDGVHSTVRKWLLPQIDPKVLPYVAYNGKRRVKRAKFDELYAPKFRNGNVIDVRKGDTLLQISINEVKENLVSISFTYSRPARFDDPLHNPERPTAGATEISGALWDEVAALKGLEQPFADVFDVESLKGERLLHWLMRTVTVLPDELKELGKKNVLLAGDAVHAQPILGGDGANAAILDGIELAEILSETGFTTDACNAFYDKAYLRWIDGIEKSENEIGSLHWGRFAYEAV
jgi:2-polyprenyl-6-methoxyphenol hydroxylase-like FAD-dependent oxidoreductase